MPTLFHFPWLLTISLLGAFSGPGPGRPGPAARDTLLSDLE